MDEAPEGWSWVGGPGPGAHRSGSTGPKKHKLRVETDGPDEGVFITRDGEIFQQSISRLHVDLTNDGRYLTIVNPVQDASQEMHISYPIRKLTIIAEYMEA